MAPPVYVVIESVAQPGRYLRFYALSHEGPKRWGELHEADRFIATEENNHIHNLAKRRGLTPDEYRIVPLPS